MKHQFSRQEIETSGRDVIGFLFENTDLKFQISKFNSFPAGLVSKKINLNFELLQKEVNEKFENYGWHGFTKSNFIESPFGDRSDVYGGLGMTYNPHHWQEIENPHLHVLGDKRYNLGTVFSGEKGKRLWDFLVLKDLKNSFYKLISEHGLRVGCEYLVAIGAMAPADVQDISCDPKAKIQRGSNTYSDTLAFNKLTPAAENGLLGDLFKKVKRTIVRSRLVELKSKGSAEVHWHTDENIFLCTRLNIPIWSTVSQRLRTEENEYALEVGEFYSWDTGRPHKIEVTGIGSRTNLVMGVSPWFDYNSKDEFWYANDYYGRLHPHEMLKNKFIMDF